MLTLRRNLMHMMVGIVLLLIYMIFGRWIAFAIMASVFVLGTWVQAQLRRGKRMPELETLLRYFETEDEIENWRGLGAQTLVLGVAITILVFPSYAAIPAILVLAFADSASAIFGTYIKSSNIIEGRTVFGSLSFAVVAFFVLQFFVSVPLAVFVAVAAALVELFPLPDDNVWIPLTVSILLTALAPFF